MRRALLAAVPLAGCAGVAAVLDPPLAQLDRWRGASPEAIAAEPVVAPCPVGHPACARLHARRAEACLSLALAGRAPGAACPPRDTHLACAAAGYAAARAAAPDPRLAIGEAQALLCLAELAPAGAPFAARAAAAAREAGHAAVRARAALAAARPGGGPDAARCAAAREGLAGAPPREAADLRARIATIPGCSP